MTERRDKLLLEIHGDGNCHICGKPKIAKGGRFCSYPHAMMPIKEVVPGQPEGCWEWATDGEDVAND